MFGIYVHFPFCEKKCNYCAFSSFVSSEEEKKRYIKALAKQISQFHNDYLDEKYKHIDTIYFGGGTPTTLDNESIGIIAQKIKENFVLSDNVEWTIECNPNSLTEEKLSYYKKIGINRISIGIQSLYNDELAFIGRLHNREGAINSIKLAKKYFDNVSCDLLIGLKGMNTQKFLNALNEIISLGVNHISTYMLQVEENTPLARMREINPHLLPDDEECINVYQKTVEFLFKQGFEQYEVSNFAKKGYECRHNLKYWSGEEYFGFGSSAHSLICSTRFASADRLADFYIGKRKLFEVLSDKEKIEEHIMLGFRCKLGISKKYLLSLGYNIEENKNFKDFLKRGVISENGDDNIILNPQYYGVNNFIIASILP